MSSHINNQWDIYGSAVTQLDIPGNVKKIKFLLLFMVQNMELVENRIPYDLMCGRAQIANAYTSERKTSI